MGDQGCRRQIRLLNVGRQLSWPHLLLWRKVSLSAVDDVTCTPATSIGVVKHFSIWVLAKFLQETLFSCVRGRKRRCKRDIPSPTFQFLNWVFHSPNSPSFEYDFPNEIEFHRRRNKKTSRQPAFGAFYRIFSSRF